MRLSPRRSRLNPPTESQAPSIGRASRWRTRVAEADPAGEAAIARMAAAPIDRAAIDAVLAELGPDWRDDAHLRSGLRKLRKRTFAALIDRDLDGRADLAETMRAMTALAECAIGEALVFLSRELAVRHGVPIGRRSGQPKDLIVVGMGKLGGGELNVSSDIDLVFVYADEGETAGDGLIRVISNEEFFTRLARRLIASLAEITADGCVFRVDMRLRPDGDSGPLVARFAMLETYLVAAARDWERFAWVKARIVSPAVFAASGAAAAAELAQLVTPFVYRRYLDFGAIDALRRLHGQIADEAARREAVRNERASRHASDHANATRIDVKLGRGGIREIEFIVQHFQLIRGGREPGLRLQPTLAMLEVLVREGLLDERVGASLREAYVFLRNVEHRLQYLDDAQTHTLPARDRVDDCERIAAMCARLGGNAPLADFDALVERLEALRGGVATQFDAVFGNASDSQPVGAPSAVGTHTIWPLFTDEAAASPGHGDERVAEAHRRLVAAGFEPPEPAYGRLLALARSSRLRSIAAAARTRLDALVPRVIDASRAEADPVATLGRWFDLIEAIAGRSAYLALLDEFPKAQQAVTRLLTASPWAAQYLTRHPLLLDELIGSPASAPATRDADGWRAHWRDVASDLAASLTAAHPEAERQMDLLRETHHAETFRLLIDDLEGRLTIEALSDQLSALADLVLDAAVTACWSSFIAGRADVPPSAAVPVFAVIAFGKLGGKELGYASDLDLVFLFDRVGDSDGEDAATVVQRYARFAQRLSLWLTARTTAGTLFDIDLRLRPDGAAGLVVTSFEAWSRYERREHDVGAWTWEHQALTRARFSAGDRVLGAAFEAERLAILAGREADAATRSQLRGEIVAMRQRMHDGHPNHSGRFDLKHDPGGMVDIEFSVQYLVLACGSVHRELLDNVGNIALLSLAAAAGLIEADAAHAGADAYRAYRAAQHASRLADPVARAARVEPDAFKAERAAVRRLWAAIFG